MPLTETITFKSLGRPSISNPKIFRAPAQCSVDRRPLAARRRRHGVIFARPQCIHHQPLQGPCWRQHLPNRISESIIRKCTHTCWQHQTCMARAPELTWM